MKLILDRYQAKSNCEIECIWNRAKLKRINQNKQKQQMQLDRYCTIQIPACMSPEISSKFIGCCCDEHNINLTTGSEQNLGFLVPHVGFTHWKTIPYRKTWKQK